MIQVIHLARLVPVAGANSQQSPSFSLQSVFETGLPLLEPSNTASECSLQRFPYQALLPWIVFGFEIFMSVYLWWGSKSNSKRLDQT